MTDARKVPDNNWIRSAWKLYCAIIEFDYNTIEQLIKKKAKELLNAKDEEGNTFLHLIAQLLMDKIHFRRRIPHVDDSSPLIQDVMNIHCS